MLAVIDIFIESRNHQKEKARPSANKKILLIIKLFPCWLGISSITENINFDSILFNGLGWIQTHGLKIHEQVPWPKNLLNGTEH